MIRVKAAPEPADFDRRVRQRGLDAIAELVGEAPGKRRPGRKRIKIAERREEIPSREFPPFWQDFIPELMTAYSYLCSYLSLRINVATGAPSVDHMVAKSSAWDKAYEWSNYRLASTLMNSRKSIHAVLDPFEITDEYFGMEFVAFQLKPGTTLKGATLKKAEETIDQLRLNSQECCKAREEYVKDYERDDISFNFLTRHAPFVALEMVRQGRTKPADSAAAAAFLKSRIGI